MKPKFNRKFTVVSATVAPKATERYWRSWLTMSTLPGYSEVWFCSNADKSEGYLDAKGKEVLSGDKRNLLFVPGVVGVVPAFARGVRQAVIKSPDYIACLHDDVEILREGWDEVVVEFFETHPRTGLVGFGGALGLGRERMYLEPYDPMSLARHDFRSNMKQAEAHGKREATKQRVAVLDGFSLIGRTEFMLNTWNHLETLGVVHHAYDAAFGAMAARVGWEVWLLPLACHHAGGATAVASRDYQEWAKGQDPEGDQGFWKKSHEIVWNEFRDVLPLRVEPPETV